jgi:hypothetical protein
VAYWRFGEASTSTPAHDTSGHGHDGLYQGAVTLLVPGALAGDTSPAIHLAGMGAMNGGDLFAFTGNASYTIEAWVRSATAGCVVARELDPDDGYALYLSSGKLKSERENDAGNDTIGAPSAISADVYHHIVTTFDGAALDLFIDGVIVSSGASSRALEGAASVPFLVGANGTGSSCPYVGDVDEVAIYDRVLTPAQIQAHHAAGVAP